MNFSLAISHTPWVPERVDSLERLVASLDRANVVYPFKLFDEKAANHVWSQKMWEWSAAQDVEWCVFLQDDAVVAPRFFDRLEVMVSEKFDVIGLQVAHPAAVALDQSGVEGFTTNDALIGVGYAIRRDALLEFSVWRETALKEGAVETISEDSLLGLWCAVTDKRVYHPIPTIVDHDTTLTSTYANDSHVNRRSRVRWDNWVQTGKSSDEIPHLGCFYASTPHMARKWVNGLGVEEYKRLLADNGHRELRKLNYLRRARGVEPKAKVFVATPVRDAVHPMYAQSVWALVKDEEIDVELGLELSDVQTWKADVVRVRSQIVTHFLNATDATHLLFLDSDIQMPPQALRGMVAAKKDFVACPYPRREGVDFKRVLENGTEHAAYRYPMGVLEDGLNIEAETNCAEVDRMPLGCCLLSRKMLTEMTERWSDFLGFEDEKLGPSVALFQLVLEKNRLMSEDFSFCHRWRSFGGKIWAYFGSGSPVNHYGDYRYQGTIEAFGMKRVAQ